MVSSSGLTVVVLYALLACAAAANTYYISVNGASSCNGKYNAPKSAAPNCAFSTFAKAASTVAAGDTVIVEAGNYVEQSSKVTVSASGTVSAPITFSGMPGAILNSSIILSGNYLVFANFTVAPAIPNGLYAIDMSGDYITVSGITVPAYGAPASLQATVFGVGGNYITVSDCTVHDLQDIDIFHVFGHDNVIKNNYVHNVYMVDYVSNHADFIQTWGGFNDATSYNILVSGNVVVNCSVQVGNTETDESPGLHDWILENNIFADIDSAFFWGVPYSTFVNNIFYNVGKNQGYALILYDQANYSSKNVSIINNAFVANDGDVEFASADPAELRLFSNNYFGTKTGGKKTGDTTYGQNVVKGGAANFVDAAGYDFHIQNGSVLIGAGLNVATMFNFNTDKDGNTRSTWDIGAYAYESLSPSTVAPTNAPTTTVAPTNAPTTTVAPTTADASVSSSASFVCASLVLLCVCTLL